MKKPNSMLMFMVLYLSGLAIGLNQFKIAPIMAVVANDLNVSLTAVSWLTSVFILAGVILAIPSAFILKSLGTKKLGVCVLILLTIGSLVGGLSQDFTLLLISRIIEGIGFAFIIAVGIVLISDWFEPKRIGTMIGIFTTFPAASSAIMLGYGAQLAQALGNWKTIWFLGAALAAVVTVAFWFVIKETPSSPAANSEEQKISLKVGLNNKKALILGMVQGAVAFIMFAYLSDYFTIFNGFYGLDAVQSGLYCSIAGYAAIVFCILSGILISKTGKPAEISLISFIILLFVCFFTFKLDSSTYIIHVILMALCTGMVIPAVLAIAPYTAKQPAYIGCAIAIVNQIYYIGAFIGPPILTSAMETDPNSAMIPLVIVSVIGIVSSIIYMLAAKKSAAQNQTIAK